jgi:hypothetical protein
MVATALPTMLQSIHHLAHAAPIPCTQDHLSPEGRVAIVSDNVYEAEAGDAKKPADMRRFVDRLLELMDPDPDNMNPGYAAPLIPDVVLVQEVRASAVASVKAALEDKTACDFIVAANAAKSPFHWADPKTRTKNIGQDTAVLVNKKTMSVKDKGYITNSYKKRFAPRGEPVVVKKHAWARVHEKEIDDTSATNLLRVAAASVHFPRGNDFKTAAIELTLKRKFAKKIADTLQAKFADPDRNGARDDDVVHVVAGDLNNKRYLNGDPSDATPMYDLMTHAPYNYRDGVINLTPGLTNPNPIDFLFSTGNFVEAKEDEGNIWGENDPNFYSNHDLRWGIVEGLDTTPPTPVDEWKNGNPFGSGLRWWLRSKDGGTGVDTYQLWRKGANELVFAQVGSVLHPTDTFPDDGTLDIANEPALVTGEAYHYEVRSCDVAGNCSGGLETGPYTAP